MSGVSTTIIVTSVFLTTLAGLGAGYMMSPAPIRTGETSPIIDPDAWNRTAPQTVQLQPAPYAQLQNSADTAPSPSGWTAPDAGAAFEEDASLVGLSSSYTIEPLDGASSSQDKGSSSITVLTASEADRAWDNAPFAVNISERADATIH